jgi:quercetin dioxygenase-like cupin family protein
MRKRLMFALAAALLCATAFGGFVQATPPNGVVGTEIAKGQFSEIDAKTITSSWQARIRTKGVSDLYVLENKIAPGGSFGWHSHPGPSLVIVKTGTLWLYFASDPTCTAHVVPAGSGFVDNGGDVHLVRNEGSVETAVYVTSLVPRGADRRINEPRPSNCSFG